MGLVVFSVFWDRTMQMVRQPSRTFTSLLAPQNTKEQHSGEKQKARRNHHSLQHECHDDGDDDDGYPANYHRSHSHQVGICHNDEGWEYDTVKFPPYT